MARRTIGEGTIYQRKNGLWCAELTLGYDENGKEKLLKHGLREAAKEAK